MTSTEIRQSFLDFFREKQHTIVPSSSLMPDSPNLLFTNAGMNQFVPIFLGQVKCPYAPGRAADTQKCIRAGGKHNDLDDVGLDTYHHTFFEMLGNWSFGDYFKKEAIDWAWELVAGRWKFPAERLYATVYSPDKSKGDPSDFDQEAFDFWAEKFRAAGLDPSVHIVNGNKKDNFWMMGETGPCGPCSELHVDLTPAGDTRGSLVNKGDARCIEIWNLVFIQFNANPDGTFSSLPAKHVDTGMGFERVASIIQGTKNFTDFASAKISNYETDIFRPIFDEIEKMSGKKYTSTLPGGDGSQISDLKSQIATDIAFRVIADHIRTLSFAIADGIQPGNTDRNYVLRRILRRAVRYGRTLGFHEPFFYKLVDVLARTMGDVFPEIRAKQAQVQEVLKREEEAFNKTLDTGLEVFDNLLLGGGYEKEVAKSNKGQIAGADAFKLYDTYGFPLDLTELMARERGLTVDVAGFEQLMEEQRARARAAQKKEIITVSDDNLQVAPTQFLGYDYFETEAVVEAITPAKNPGEFNVILDRTACYAEMGGQVGDHGVLELGDLFWPVLNTQKRGDVFVHRLGSAGSLPAASGSLPDASSPSGEAADCQKNDATRVGNKLSGRLPESAGKLPALPEPGQLVRVAVDILRRNAIQRHHTVTHLLHWALHEVVSHDATQKGSFVGPDKLTFDFNSAALTPAQVRDIEKLVNERIVQNAGVSWTETPYTEVKARPNIMQFFGDKYGDTVRVVQIGGRAGAFDGYSMELCGGTHTRATGEIGLFRIVSEAAIAAGVRRIEAVAGLSAFEAALSDSDRLKAFAAKLNAPLGELEKKLDVLLAQQKELEKSLKAAQQREAAGQAKGLLASAETFNGTPAIIANLGDADGETLQVVADALKSQFQGVIVLGGTAGGAVSLVASVTPEFTAKVQAGKIIQQIAPIVGGKGGGKPDNARGGGKEAGKLDEALAKAKALL